MKRLAVLRAAPRRGAGQPRTGGPAQADTAPWMNTAQIPFNPSTGNTATIAVPSASTRFVRITVAANTGRPAGQVSELQAYAS
jgi:hypothetical protein